MKQRMARRRGVSIPDIDVVPCGLPWGMPHGGGCTQHQSSSSSSSGPCVLFCLLLILGLCLSAPAQASFLGSEEEESSQAGAVVLPLSNRLHAQGHPFGSVEYHHERLNLGQRRLQAMQQSQETGRNLRSGRNGEVHEDTSGLYFVKLSLGTPRQTLHLSFDTSSSLLWASCKCPTCPKSSSLVKLRQFKPAESSTCHHIPCSSTNACSVLANSTLLLGSNPPFLGSTEGGGLECRASGKCGFSASYLDGSAASGSLLQDTLTLKALKTTTGGTATASKAGLVSKCTNGVGSNGTKSEHVKGTVVFGCASKQTGSFLDCSHAVDGVLGMAQSPESVLAQLTSAGVVENAFSFCIDSGSSKGSFAVIGQSSMAPPNLTTTPLVSNPTGSPMYYLGLKQMLLGAEAVQDSDTLGNIEMDGSGGVILDTASPLTALPQAVLQNMADMLATATGFNFYPSDKAPFCTLTQNETLFNFPPLVLDMGMGAQWTVQPKNYMIPMDLDGGTLGYKFCLSATVAPSSPFNAIIGEDWISDHFVHLDIEMQQLSWADTNCTSIATNLPSLSANASVPNPGPALSPNVAPAPSLTPTPLKAPTKAPTKAPAPAKAPTKAPANAPAPAKAPIKAPEPARSPPAGAPATAPVAPSARAPVMTPAKSPIMGPTKSPPSAPHAPLSSSTPFGPGYSSVTPLRSNPPAPAPFPGGPLPTPDGLLNLYFPQEQITPETVYAPPPPRKTGIKTYQLQTSASVVLALLAILLFLS